MREKLQKGDWVAGNLIHERQKATVIAAGPYSFVKRYDLSGAMGESIRMRDIPSNEWCIAVRFSDGDTAVYPRSEVWRARDK